MQSLWMIVAALFFSLMGVAVKLASSHYNTWEIVMYRGLIGAGVMGSMIVVHARATGTSIAGALKTRRLPMHLTRGISGTISLTLWFFAIAGLPIATAMTINYSSPLFIGAWLAFCAFRLGERPDVRMLSTLVFGFFGVMLLLRPTVASNQWIFAALGIVGAALTAVAYLSVKALAQVGEPSARIVFYFTVMNGLTGLGGASFFGFHGHTPTGFAYLAAVGLTATLGQLAMTRAYASGGTLLTANLGFTGIIFSTAWGVLLFGDVVGLDSVIGMAIIVAAGVTATLMTARAERRVRARREAIATPATAT